MITIPPTIGDVRSRFHVERHLLFICMLSLGMIAYAAVKTDKIMAAVAAALFAQRLIWTGFQATGATPAMRHANDDHSPPRKVLLETTRLTAITLTWGSLALLIAYPLAGLTWQHGWQYGLGAALLAIGFFIYAGQLTTSSNAVAQPAAIHLTRRLAMAQALAIVACAAWLIGSGKLATDKSDWLANDVFLAICAAVFALSCLFVVRARQD